MAIGPASGTAGCGSVRRQDGPAAPRRTAAAVSHQGPRMDLVLPYPLTVSVTLVYDPRRALQGRLGS